MGLMEQCEEHKKLTVILNDINNNVSEIKTVLIGGIIEGEYKPGFLDKLKAVKKTQIVINTILISVLAGTIVVVIANTFIIK